MSELSKVDIYRQIDVLRQNLLDLTMRNQLLNFRPRSMTVEVKEADLAEIYDRLILKKSKRKLLQFIPRSEMEGTVTTPGDNYLDQDNKDSSPEESQPRTQESVSGTGQPVEKTVDENSTTTTISLEDPELNEEALTAPDESDLSGINTISGEEGYEESLLWEAPSLDQETLEKNKEIFLSTDLTPAELQRRLFYINQRARSMMEEQGYNILYLALGFLKWRDDNGNHGEYTAPLILIPVELERKRVKGSFKLRWTGEDIISNISLQANYWIMGWKYLILKCPVHPRALMNTWTRSGNLFPMRRIGKFGIVFSLVSSVSPNL
nr:DUF4011 domain-containing protein [Methanobacterium formicicum]